MNLLLISIILLSILILLHVYLIHKQSILIKNIKNLIEKEIEFREEYEEDVSYFNDPDEYIRGYESGFKQGQNSIIKKKIN